MQNALPKTFSTSQSNIIFIGSEASLVVLKIAAPALYIAMNGIEREIDKISHDTVRKVLDGNLKEIEQGKRDFRF